MTVVKEQIAASPLVDGSETDLHSHPTGGAGPALQGIFTVDPPNIAKSTTINVDIPVIGVLTTHKIYVQCQSDLEHGLICIATYCPADGTIRIRLSNLSIKNIDDISRIWGYKAYN